MTRKDPDDTVRKEQLGSTDNDSLSEDNVQANNTQHIKPEEEHKDPIEDKNLSDTTPKLTEDEEESHDEGEKEETAIAPQLPEVDYSGYSKHELVETLGLIVENRPADEIKDDVERIKSLFYKNLKVEEDERKSKFLEEGGKIEDYRPMVDPDDERVKKILDVFKEKKSSYNRVQEAEKQENLKKKHDIIDKIKDLVNREESINKTFHDFRELQNEWHSIGIVPPSSLKNLWENYHHAVEIFYDYIKINKELKDLDLKKNLEAKITLCEKAEGLLLEEPDPVNAFRSLQEYHNQWREIGPVTRESKSEIWERFKEATSQINKRHHEYFENQKDEQRKNLETKISLCEEIESINLLEIKNFKEFDEHADKVIGLQKKWRTIGFAPKKQNTKVYLRFRKGCDTFFEKKRQFYTENKEIQLNNLQLKTDLCMKAEALQNSEDWKATSDALIKLQKEWKEIGPVPRKHSEKCWRRFRKACDHFFNRKSQHFAELDSSYEDNLKKKLDIIEELVKFEHGTDARSDFEFLKDIQRRWAEIGFVPFNKKDEISNKYRDALNLKLNKLNIPESDWSLLKYKTKLDTIRTSPKSSRKLKTEREKFYTKIKQLEGEIVLWENNIGFFAKSKNADTMIKEVESKIENAKKTIKTLEEKIKIIDQTGLGD